MVEGHGHGEEAGEAVPSRGGAGLGHGLLTGVASASKTMKWRDESVEMADESTIVVWEGVAIDADKR